MLLILCKLCLFQNSEFTSGQNLVSFTTANILDDYTLISLSFAKFPKAAMIFGIAAASVSCTDSSERLLTRVKQGKRFTKYGL